MQKKEKIVIGLCVIASIAAGTLHYANANAVLAFVVTAAALALHLAEWATPGPVKQHQQVACACLPVARDAQIQTRGEYHVVPQYVQTQME